MRKLVSVVVALTLLAPALDQPKPAVELPHLVLDPGGHTSTVRTALFTADGKHVITGGYDKSIRIWDMVTGEVVRVFHLPVGEPDREGRLFHRSGCRKPA